MVWTQERINLLIDLWMSGKSASTVAKELGNVSRNAVIGKVHRLGISNRDNTQKVSSLSNSASLKKELYDNSKIQVQVNRKSKQSKSSKKITILSAVKEKNTKISRTTVKRGTHTGKAYSKQSILESDPDASMEFKRLSLLELRDKHCRWPSGDPRDSNFSFCGCPTADGSPYCAYHSKIAYSQPSKSEAKQYISIENKSNSNNDDFQEGINIDTIKVTDQNTNSLNYA